MTTDQLKASLKRWTVRAKKARAMVARRKKQLAASTQADAQAAPRIVVPSLSFTDKFGQLGPERFVTGHHTAGPTDKSLDDALRLDRQYHAEHAAKGWGGIGYHYNIARTGEIICLRPTILKGAHVGSSNSNNVGVMFHGTTGDRPTDAQRRSYAWLLANAHTDKLPPRHRTDLDLRKATRRGHNDWPTHTTNACPGTHKAMILAGG